MRWLNKVLTVNSTVPVSFAETFANSCQEPVKTVTTVKTVGSVTAAFDERAPLSARPAERKVIFVIMVEE
eukprot:813964-Prorocentrum_minimum.AAC.1